MEAYKLMDILAEKGWSGSAFARKLSFIGKDTFWKYKDMPEEYSFLQLEEMAKILNMSTRAFLIDLGLIK